MPYVAALYRYPVKGLTPEPREALTIMPDGRVEGDRVLGFRFANVAGDDWGTKHNMLVLMNTPGLARLNLSFDSEGDRLALSVDRVKLVDAVLDEEGRALISAAVADYVQRTRENPLAGNPERLPLRLIGDGQTAKYQDSKDGYVTMHGRGSLIALGGGAERVGHRRGAVPLQHRAGRSGRVGRDDLGWAQDTHRPGGVRRAGAGGAVHRHPRQS